MFLDHLLQIHQPATQILRSVFVLLHYKRTPYVVLEGECHVALITLSKSSSLPRSSAPQASVFVLLYASKASKLILVHNSSELRR